MYGNVYIYIHTHDPTEAQKKEKCIHMYGNVYIYLGFVYLCTGICMRDLRIIYGGRV